VVNACKSARLAVLVCAAIAGCSGPGAFVASALGAIAQTPPSDAISPQITGVPGVGRTLSVASGSWSGDSPISFTFQWLLCDGSGANCMPLSAASSPSYTVAAADLGGTFVVGVTAVNDAGTGVAVSAPTGVVTLAAPPVASSQPSAVGPTARGSTLTATGSTWTGDGPLVFGYRWERCGAAGGGCATIPGASGQSYLLGASDVGFRLQVVVTATNAFGSGRISSILSGVIGSAPTSLAPPTLTGTMEVGQTLSAEPGRWTGTGPLVYTYVWQRCSRAGASCASLAGATWSSYTLGADDLGSRLRVLVTASGPLGSATAASAATVAVSEPPVPEPPVPEPPVPAPASGALAGDPFPVGAIGYDTSYPDCGRRPPAGGFVIVGVNDGRPFTRNPCFRREYAWATSRDAPSGIYLNTAYSPALLGSITPGCERESSEQDVNAQLAAAYALGCSEASSSLDALAAISAPTSIWLDVETSNPWSRRRSLNAETIEGMLDAVSALSPEAIVGVYSDRHWWQEITGDMTSPTTPEWTPAGVGRGGCPEGFAGGPVWISQGGGASLDVDLAC